MSDKAFRSSSLLASLRRSVGRAAPSAVEEMRPMLASSNAKTNTAMSTIASSQTTAQQRPSVSAGAPRTTAAPASPPRTSAATASASSSSAAFEISLRDKTDATAKRGFRVQVPKRMLCYTILVFVGLPLFLFGYVEVHNRSMAAAAHAVNTHGEENQHATNHHYDKYKVANILDIDDDGDNKNTTLGSSETEGETAASNSATTGMTADGTSKETEKIVATTTKSTDTGNSTGLGETEKLGESKGVITTSAGTAETTNITDATTAKGNEAQSEQLATEATDGKRRQGIRGR